MKIKRTTLVVAIVLGAMLLVLVLYWGQGPVGEIPDPLDITIEGTGVRLPDDQTP